MFGINLQRSTKVTSATEIEPYIAILKKREFNGSTPTYYFEEEIEIPGFFPFRLSKSIVGSTKTPLSRGFGELVLDSTSMLPEYSHIASISIGAKNQENNQSIVVGLLPEEVPITTDEVKIARFAISQALYGIVEGEPSLTVQPIDDTQLIASLYERFTARA